MPGLSIPLPTKRNLFLIALLLVTTGLAYLAVILPIYNPFNSETILAGSVAKQDVVAPTSLTYDSKLLTDAERERAAAQVAPIYTAPDANVSRNQAEKLRNALAFISTVRNDVFATEEQKLSDLQALEKAIDSKASKEELKTAMAKYRAAQSAKQAKLEAAQEELKKVLSTQQEALLLSMGMIK